MYIVCSKITGCVCKSFSPGNEIFTNAATRMHCIADVNNNQLHTGERDCSKQTKVSRFVGEAQKLNAPFSNAKVLPDHQYDRATISMSTLSKKIITKLTRAFLRTISLNFTAAVKIF